jgi:hypothetical protein
MRTLRLYLSNRIYWLLAPILIAVTGVLLDIDLPGLYMDAVNPDYMVPRMLGEAKNSSIWVMPGNLFFGRYPLLPSLYHGSGQAWLGAPFYMILGTDIFAIRLTHGLMGIAVLVSGMLLLRKIGVWPWLILFVGCVVALDPSFVFAFRTQFYITTTPLIALFGAIYFLVRARDASLPMRSLLMSGIFFGASVFGYFIYGFFLPAFLICVWFAFKNNLSTSARTLQGDISSFYALRRWGFGFVLGMLPYIIGYAIIFQRTGGPIGFVDFLANMQKTLGVFAGNTATLGRVEAIWAYFLGVSSHAAQSAYWVGYPLPLRGATTKSVILIAMPLAFWAVAECRRTATIWTRFFIGASASFCLCALIFGARLGSHHMIVVYIFLHFAFAITAYDALRNWKSYTGEKFSSTLDAVPSIMLASLLIAMAAQNLHGQMISRTHLRETGGVGLYSDAINQFAADALRSNPTAYYVMPDWGLLMPSIFLTSGRIEITADENIDRVREQLCQGREVKLVLITGDRTARFSAMAEKLSVPTPLIQSWKQRDGKTVFEVGTLLPNRLKESSSCTSKNR